MRYKAMPAKGDVDAESALLQGALALDAAGEVAEKTNNAEGLLNVAAMWLKFSEAIGQYASTQPDDKKEEVLKAGQIQIGFQAGPRHEDIVADEEEDIDD